MLNAKQSLLLYRHLFFATALATCLGGCSAQAKKDGANTAAAVSQDAVLASQFQFAQMYSEPVSKELSSVNVAFNNTKAYALTSDDLQVLKSEELLVEGDLDTLQPFIKQIKK